jgi:formylglycine-generating enzyme required for sulfatase activity
MKWQVDAFECAVYPVTQAQYADFLAATRHEAPREWPDRITGVGSSGDGRELDRRSGVLPVAHRRRRLDASSRPRRNGNSRHAADWPARSIRGVTRFLRGCPTAGAVLSMVRGQ